MYRLVKDVFNDKCSLTFNANLADKIETYLNALITKDAETAAFYGGALIGCYRVVFTASDRNDWFQAILGIDESDVEDHLAELIDPNAMKVIGDPFSLSCVWLAHSFWNSGSASTDVKKRAMIDIMTIMRLRFLTSRMSRHWPYQTSTAVAEATLAKMSNKYDIKRLGSWLKVLKEGAEDTVNMVNGIHKNALARMDLDMRPSGGHKGSVVYIIMDNATRIKKMLLGIYGLQLEVQHSGLRINSTSATFIETDGVATLKDKEQALDAYKSYLLTIIGDRRSFIKLDLLSIIESANKTMPINMFRMTLTWLSDNYASRKDMGVNLEDLIERIMNHLLIYLNSNKNAMKNKSDIPGLLSNLKGIYTSSRSTDPLLLGIRSDLEEVVRKATKIKVPASVSATRTGIMMYIVLRAVTKGHYG